MFVALEQTIRCVEIIWEARENAVYRIIKALTHVQLPSVDVVVRVVADACFCAETGRTDRDISP